MTVPLDFGSENHFSSQQMLMYIMNIYYARFCVFVKIIFYESMAMISFTADMYKLAQHHPQVQLHAKPQRSC